MDLNLWQEEMEALISALRAIIDSTPEVDPKGETDEQARRFKQAVKDGTI